MQILFLNIDKRPVPSVSRMSNTMVPAQRRGEERREVEMNEVIENTWSDSWKPGHTDKMNEKKKIVMGSWPSFIPTAIRRLMFYLAKYEWANYTPCQNCMKNIVFFLICVSINFTLHILFGKKLPFFAWHICGTN